MEPPLTVFLCPRGGEKYKYGRKPALVQKTIHDREHRNQAILHRTGYTTQGKPHKETRYERVELSASLWWWMSPGHGTSSKKRKRRHTRSRSDTASFSVFWGLPSFLRPRGARKGDLSWQQFKNLRCTMRTTELTELFCVSHTKFSGHCVWKLHCSQPTEHTRRASHVLHTVMPILQRSSNDHPIDVLSFDTL